MRTNEQKNEIFKNAYDNWLARHGCGYWGVCVEHACIGCAIEKANQGYDFDVFTVMRNRSQEVLNEE